jgi:myo-inositol catabolism protein IolC
MTTFLLAFDHRRSLLTSFFDVDDDPDERQVASAREIKTVIADGLLRAIDRSRVDRGEAGGLVDATFGGIAIDRLRTAGVRFAVPVEASGERELRFEHPDWRERLDAIHPTWAKVLVRYNPSADAAMNGRQRDRLLDLQTVARAFRVGFLLELLVPPEPAQRTEDYDIATRPGLVVDAIDELRGAGVQPDLWKIEGLERREDCATVAEHAGAPCVVLGRGADADAVERWLRAGAGIFDGFAIGRSIWWDAARTYVAGSVDRDATVTAIAERYGHFVDVFHAGT